MQLGTAAGYLHRIAVPRVKFSGDHKRTRPGILMLVARLCARRPGWTTKLAGDPTLRNEQAILQVAFTERSRRPFFFFFFFFFYNQNSGSPQKGVGRRGEFKKGGLGFKVGC